MPASFDDVLSIDKDGHIFPKGPLDSKSGETVRNVYAWVFQQNTSGSDGACLASQGDPGKFVNNKWITGPGDAIHEGRFQPGGALAMAVRISTDTSGNTKVFWWSETISVA